MAMSAISLKNAILDALDTEIAKYDFSSGERMPTSKPMEVISDAIKNYLEDNMEIIYGWSAVSGGGSPDPVVSFISSISFSSFILTYAENLQAFALQLQTLLLSGVITHPVGFTLPSGSLYAVTSFSLSPIGVNDRDQCWAALCTSLVNYIKTMVNPVPLAGSHGSYTGSTTSMTII